MADLDPLDESPGGAGARPELHLAEYWDIVFKRRRLVGACLVVALLFAALITVVSRPSYMAVAVVDVERSAPTPVVFSGSRGDASTAEFLPSQIRLMASREIAERVVQRLNLLGDPDFNPEHYQTLPPRREGQGREAFDREPHRRRRSTCRGAPRPSS